MGKKQHIRCGGCVVFFVEITSWGFFLFRVYW